MNYYYNIHGIVKIDSNIPLGIEPISHLRCKNVEKVM